MKHSTGHTKTHERAEDFDFVLERLQERAARYVEIDPDNKDAWYNITANLTGLRWSVAKLFDEGAESAE